MLTFTGSACRVLGVQPALSADLLVCFLGRLRFLDLLGRSKLAARKLMMQSVGAAVSRIILAVGLRIVGALETERTDAHAFLLH